MSYISNKSWDNIRKVAREHGLTVSAFGGSQHKQFFRLYKRGKLIELVQGYREAINVIKTKF